MLSVDEAHQRILQTVPRLPAERVPIERAAGEILREPVSAERDQPPFDRVTMDGIALRHAAFEAGRREFRSLGAQPAGASALAVTDAACCVEVMTGTPLPDGTDTIVPVERIVRHERDGAVYLRLADDVLPQVGEFIHRRGSDYLEAATLLAAGTRLGAPEMAVLASSGLATVAVARRPRIAVLPTGDELVPPGRPIAPHQIRRSNDFAIAAALRLRGFGAIEVEALADDPDGLRCAISRQLEARDVLILSGGVSMGQFDHLPRIMGELGVEAVFHRIRQRPGRPMWFGIHRGLGSVVFALPGNPVSSLVCLIRFVAPALWHAMGLPPPPSERVQLAEAVSFAPALTWHLPVRVVQQEGDAVPLAIPQPTNTSGDFAALAGTAGFVELPAERNAFPAGYVAPLWRW